MSVRMVSVTAPKARRKTWRRHFPVWVQPWRTRKGWPYVRVGDRVVVFYWQPSLRAQLAVKGDDDS
jgi:hypothetical protein